jgi:hypothetical protein
MVRPIHLPLASRGWPKNASVAPIADIAANARGILVLQHAMAAVSLVF